MHHLQCQNKKYLYLVQSSLGDLYTQLREYEQTQNILQGFTYIEAQSPLATHSMATSFFHKGDLDSASYYYNKLLSFDDIYSRLYAHWGLAEIAQHGGNSQSALEHLRLYKVYTDSIREMTRASEVRKMQSLFNYQLREKENRQLEKEVIKQTQSKQRILFLFALLVAGIVICWQFDKLKKHFRKNQARELKSIQMAQYRKSDAFIEENEKRSNNWTKKP